MAEERVERRLAAILAADVAGYSRLMSEDEAGTLAAWQRCQSELIDPGIARHRGRIVKLMGDGLLAEFPSVVEAVDCAAEIQREMALRDADTASDRRLNFRIGVHLGEMIVEGNDIHGDGVNIAARLESIAEPGGICVYRQVYDQVQKKLTLGYRNLGPRNLKNIPDPIEVFAIKGDGPAAGMIDQQEIRYCRAPDGVRLAYAMSGQGKPLVKTANWMNHLEYDWACPIWHPFLLGLSKSHQLVRYDAAATVCPIGMSPTCHSMPGSAISKRWLKQPVSSNFPCSVFHKAVQFRLLTRSGTRSALLISFCTAALQSAPASGRRRRRQSEKRLDLGAA